MFDNNKFFICQKKFPKNCFYCWNYTFSFYCKKNRQTGRQTDKWEILDRQRNEREIRQTDKRERERSDRETWERESRQTDRQERVSSDRQTDKRKIIGGESVPPFI